MKASDTCLKSDESFQKLHSLTCIAHGLNNVADEARRQFKKADYVIMTVKSVFLKAPKWPRLLRRNQPDLGTPPSPVTTRWCTWLEATTKFYAVGDNCKKLADGLRHIRDTEITPKKQFELLELQKNKLQKLKQKMDAKKAEQEQHRAEPNFKQEEKILQQQQILLEQQLDMMEHQIQSVNFQKLQTNRTSKP